MAACAWFAAHGLRPMLWAVEGALVIEGAYTFLLMWRGSARLRRGKMHVAMGPIGAALAIAALAWWSPPARVTIKDGETQRDFLARASQELFR